MEYPYYDYAVIGGDMRQVYLAQELATCANRICHYALPAPLDERCCCNDSVVTAAESFEEICRTSACIIGPIPFSKNGSFLNQTVFDNPLSLEPLLAGLHSGQSFFAGCIPEEFKKAAQKKGVRIYDLMDDFSLSCFNTIAAAEGAVCEAIQHSGKNLHHSRCALLGYGKCGRTLAHCLKGLSCHVYTVSNSPEERALASLIADKTGTLLDFAACAGEFDFIFNTIPALVITDDLLSQMNHSVTIIDIASAPGGVDYAAAKKLEIHALLCPGLPGKYAPIASARAIKETVNRILKE